MLTPVICTGRAAACRQRPRAAWARARGRRRMPSSAAPGRYEGFFGDCGANMSGSRRPPDGHRRPVLLETLLRAFEPHEDDEERHQDHHTNKGQDAIRHRVREDHTPLSHALIFTPQRTASAGSSRRARRLRGKFEPAVIGSGAATPLSRRGNESAYKRMSCHLTRALRPADASTAAILGRCAGSFAAAPRNFPVRSGLGFGRKRKRGGKVANARANDR